MNEKIQLASNRSTLQEKWLGTCEKCGKSIFIGDKYTKRIFGEVAYYSHKKCP